MGEGREALIQKRWSGGEGGGLFKILALSVGTYYSKKYDVYHYKIVQIQTAKS